MQNFLTNFRRVMRAGFINFWRNGLVSFTSIFVVTVTLFIVGSLFLTQAFLDSVLGAVEDKVDINVYLKSDSSENSILALRKQIEALPEVKVVEYTSREDALARFKERNKDNSLVLQALEELNDNPLGAVFNIKAKLPSQYEGIAQFLSKHTDEFLGEGNGIIDKINFFENKVVIDRLTKIIDTVERVAFAASLVLGVMAVLVTFNTIRLAIYVARQEINIMRLVGANDSYIRGPFVIEGVMYGVIAAILALALLYPSTLWISKSTASYLGGLDLFAYYTENFGQMFAILLGLGVVLGALSSVVAVRRYLNE